MDVTAWVETYRTAWETADTDLVLTLFTEDASYRSNPFEERTSDTMGSARTGTV